MQIAAVISDIKGLYKKVDTSILEHNQTRDTILFGDEQRECTGIVICLWASIESIEQAHLLGANLIICHEALFWNHGDKQDFLQQSSHMTFQKKRDLLERYQMTVWRCHDTLHAGIQFSDGSFSDGIFYGFAYYMGWLEHASGDRTRMQEFSICERTAKELSLELIERLGVGGVKLIGNPNQLIQTVRIPFHIFGDDNDEILYLENEQFDAILPMEMVDYTVAQYLCDANKVALCLGHFCLEEPGMRYMAELIQKKIKWEIPVHFVAMRGYSNYIVSDTE